MKSIDWVGKKSGKLTIVGFVGIRQFPKGRATVFKFRCECGEEFEAQKSNVWGRKTDCGCSRRMTATAPPGASSNPLHKVWRHMIDRCENDRNKSFKDYGARGIKVCQRWQTGDGSRTGYECFLGDMGPRPEGNYTIERVNGSRNYEPGNCVWLPKGDQSKNRRTVRLVRIQGQVRTIPDWCKETGVPYFTAMRRIGLGWPPNRAVQQPVRTQGRL